MRRATVSWQAVVLLAVLMVGLFGYGLYRNKQDLKSARSTESTVRAQLTKLENDKLSLQTAIDNVDTDAFVEMYVRENLDFMKPGELRFEVSNSELLRSYREEENAIILAEMALNEQ